MLGHRLAPMFRVVHLADHRHCPRASVQPEKGVTLTWGYLIYDSSLSQRVLLPYRKIYGKWVNPDLTILSGEYARNSGFSPLSF